MGSYQIALDLTVLARGQNATSLGPLSPVVWQCIQGRGPQHHYQPGTTTNVSRGMTGASRDVDGHHDMLTGRSKTTQNIDDARNEMGAIT
jgi:hypothetical protein